MDFYFCVNSVHFSRDPIFTSPVSCLLLPFSSFSKRLKSPGCHRQADSSFVHVIAPGILFAGTWALSNLDSLWLDQLRSLLWEIPSPPKVPALMPKPCAPRWTLWGEWNAGEPHSTQSTGLRVEDSYWPPELGPETHTKGRPCLPLWLPLHPVGLTISCLNGGGTKDPCECLCFWWDLFFLKSLMEVSFTYPTMSSFSLYNSMIFRKRRFVAITARKF